MKRPVAALAVLVAVAIAAPASAQVTLPVTLANGEGSRTMYVEDLLGNELTGFAFGEATSQPFRVRVVDDSMDRTPFTVSAQMTKLYRLVDGSLVADQPIASGQLRVDPVIDPSVSGVLASVQPVVDIVLHSTDPVVCTLLGVLTGSCDIPLADLTAKVQDVAYAADTVLDGLPIVPGSTEPGAFDTPAYTGESPDAPGTPPAATSRTLLSGNTNEDLAFLTDLTSQLQTLVDGLSSVTDLVDSNALISALPPALQSLSGATLTALLGSDFTATVHDVVVSQVLSLTGTYLAFPKLSVTVPGDAPGGSYQGTLIVTGIS
jgi:hypothetical protein